MIWLAIFFYLTSGFFFMSACLDGGSPLRNVRGKEAVAQLLFITFWIFVMVYAIFTIVRDGFK